MTKISNMQVAQMMKLAADNLRVLSVDNVSLREKLAFYEKKDRAEKIASAMEAKGLEPELSIHEKVAGLMKREDLGIVEEAVSMSAPQMKLASVHEAGGVVSQVEGGDNEGGNSESDFVNNLLAMGD